MDASLFISDTSTPCAFNITPTNTERGTDKPTEKTPQNNTGIHFHSNINTGILLEMHAHHFDNGDAFTYKNKYTALL